MPRPKADKDARRTELAAVAARVFAERGVAATAVSDIARAAGIAQGTFYLYFDSKDDIVLEVVEQLADSLTASIADAVAAAPTAPDKLLALRDALVSADVDPEKLEIADFIHRPENRAIHDRLAEKLLPALIPVVESIVACGLAEKVFHVPDARTAAWFVLGGLQSAELAGTSSAEMPAVIHAVTELSLRALGYEGELR